MINTENIPASLRAIPRWLPYILVPSSDADAKPRKIPINPNTLEPGNRPEHCADFELVLDLYRNAKPFPLSDPPYEQPAFAGIGFRFEYDESAPFVFVDFDNCIGPDGMLDDWVDDCIDCLDSYTELSQSGTGIHILLRSSAPPAGRCRSGNTEIYSTGRWAVMTGLHLEGTPRDLEDRTEKLLPWYECFFSRAEATPSQSGSLEPLVTASDDELLWRARNARNGDRFRALYDTLPTRPNHSEEDLALCNMLAFWTGGDTDRIDRLFRGSQLVRSKWLERNDYRLRTIQKAIETYHQARRGRGVNRK